MAFVDSEGEPWQELSCILLSPTEKRIVAVYHKFAVCPPYVDEWARLHVHGLDPIYLLEHGFPNEALLIDDFEQWLAPYDVICMYANNPQHEDMKLKRRVLDIALPKWVDRFHLISHQIPLMYKLYSVPFQGIVCDHHIHREYRHEFIRRCRTPIKKVKALHGYHCSLADVHELCLFYLQTRL